jgi:hypothetical protein
MVVLFLSACDSSVSPAGGHDRYFPNTVGSQWHYSVTYDWRIDTTRAIPGIDWTGIVIADTVIDTVTLTIAGDTVLESAGATAVQWKLSHAQDSLGFPYERLWLKGGGRARDGDTVAWYLRPSADRPAFFFVAPLEDGQAWTCTDCVDYYWVYHQHSWVKHFPVLDTPAGRFTDVYAFAHTFECGDECGGFIMFYLADRVGLVKLTQQSFSGGNAGGDFETFLTWELKEYNLE